MGAHTVVKLEAYFAMEDQGSCLVVRELPDGRFDVSATYRQWMSPGFPDKEVVERTGTIFSLDIEALVGAILVVAGEEWFHHYHGVDRPRFWEALDYSWGLRIEYADGMMCRWEGVDGAPQSLDAVYGLLVSFGMPSLHPQYLDEATFTCPDARMGVFGLLTCYEGLLREAAGSGQGTSAAFRQLAAELLEDIERFLCQGHAPFEMKSLLKVWGIKPSLSYLDGVDVHDAPRAKMMALLGALTVVPDPVNVIGTMIESGSFGLWCARLNVIPQEEREERRREIAEKYRILMLSVDDALDKRMKSGKVFTSYEVASEMGVTPLQVSGRIRKMVRSGKLQPVGEGYPRRYKAA